MNEAAHPDTHDHGGQATDGALALKQFAAERLAQHRTRRASQQTQLFETAQNEAARRSGARGAASRVREAVAARYEQTVSYREFLAQEAGRATERAQAEAEIAARNARAIADAQRQLLSELFPPEAGPQVVPSPVRTLATPAVASVAEPAAPVASPFDADDFFAASAPRAEAPQAAAVSAAAAPSWEPGAPRPEPAASSSSYAPEAELAPEPYAPTTPEIYDGYDPYTAYAGEAPGLRVQLAGDLSSLSPASAAHLRRVLSGGGVQELGPEESAYELEALDAELAFRHSEAFDGQSLALTPIPGNLIEFPRQLIAARKVRPRLAEGPLREEHELDAPQLRIFEVEPELLNVTPEMEDASTAEWHGMVLDSPILRIEDPEADLPMLPASVQIPVPVTPASIERRVMSMVVDAICIAFGFVGFFTVFGKLAPHVLASMTLPRLGTLAAVALAVLYLLYQMLFFTLSEATPGMRVARLSLCTFTDDVPSRKSMRRRVGTTLLAAAPLGLGIFWLAIDGERLGWHDRMSRMYPREY